MFHCAGFSVSVEPTDDRPLMLTGTVATGVSVTENGCSQDESAIRLPAGS